MIASLARSAQYDSGDAIATGPAVESENFQRAALMTVRPALTYPGRVLVSRGAIMPRGGVTLADYADEWLRECAPKRYRDALARYYATHPYPQQAIARRVERFLTPQFVRAYGAMQAWSQGGVWLDIARTVRS